MLSSSPRKQLASATCPTNLCRPAPPTPECKKGLVCYNGGNCVPDPTKPDQEMCACASECCGSASLKRPA